MHSKSDGKLRAAVFAMFPRSGPSSAMSTHRGPHVKAPTLIQRDSPRAKTRVLCIQFSGVRASVQARRVAVPPAAQPAVPIIVTSFCYAAEAPLHTTRDPAKASVHLCRSLSRHFEVQLMMARVGNSFLLVGVI